MSGSTRRCRRAAVGIRAGYAASDQLRWSRPASIQAPEGRGAHPASVPTSHSRGALQCSDCRCRALRDRLTIHTPDCNGLPCALGGTPPHLGHDMLNTSAVPEASRKMEFFSRRAEMPSAEHKTAGVRRAAMTRWIVRRRSATAAPLRSAQSLRPRSAGSASQQKEVSRTKSCRTRRCHHAATTPRFYPGIKRCRIKAIHFAGVSATASWSN